MLWRWTGTKALHFVAAQEVHRCSRKQKKAIRRFLLKEQKMHLQTEAKVIATACPFCMTMMTDGLKYKNKEEEIKNYDIAELIAQSLDL